MTHSKQASQIIPIGGDSSAPYVAFGDESQFGDILAYAFAVISRKLLPSIEKSIAELKIFYGLPSDKPIHCRVLFNNNARERHGLSHISYDVRQKIISRIVKIVNSHSVWLRYNYCFFSKSVSCFSQFNGQLPMQGVYSDEISGYLPINSDIDPKSFMGYLMNGCFTPTKHRYEPPLSACQIILSQEKTKVKTIHGGKRKAHNLCNGFSDIDAPNGSVFQFSPTIEDAKNLPMLEIADVFAYMVSHAVGLKSGDQHAGFLNEQLGNIRHWTRSRLVFTSEEPGLHLFEQQV